MARESTPIVQVALPLVSSCLVYVVAVAMPPLHFKTCHMLVTCLCLQGMHFMKVMFCVLHSETYMLPFHTPVNVK